MAKKIKNIVFIMIMLLLLIPAIQGIFHIFSVRALEGDFIPAPRPTLTIKSWLNMDFQNAFEPYLEENVGFHNDLVRLHNQLDYSLYSKLNAEGVVIGKDGQLYEKDYIRAYLGRDFVGYQIIDRKARRLKFLQEHLKNEFDIDMVIILEPGKASIYPEYIPDRFDVKNRTSTNYQAYIEKFEEYEVKYVNLNSYFMDIKHKLEYPVFTKNGIHWSIYAMTFAADTMLKYIESIRRIEMPGVYIDSWVRTDQPQRTDNDVSRTLNLICEPPMDTTAYPEYRFEENDTKEKPMVLVIGDSFYWNFFNTRIPKHLFNNEAFWYFYKQVFPDSYDKPLSVSDLDLQAEIEKQDVVILTVTERFQFNFDWGFIDDLYMIYAPPSPYDKIYTIQNDIVKYDQWFNNIILKARKRGLSLENMLYTDVLYTLEMNNPLAYFSLFGADHYIKAIQNDPNWLTMIRGQAKDKGISLEQNIRENADFMLQEYHPEAYKKYYALQSTINGIKGDSAWLSQVREKAKKYYIPLEEMMLIDAEYLYKLEK
ncbi:MAG: hypothetical protein U9R60_03215 [Bacteroidota bacterium]|nr:hypothetical protein [Bacteroidota bacterium]